MQGGMLYVTTPINRVLALQPDDGAVRWVFDPQIDQTKRYAEGFVSRGVAYWEHVPQVPRLPCNQRLFLATIDARLFALDARTGALCKDFGLAGTIRLDSGVPYERGLLSPGEYGVTSPPAVIGGVVVVGSTVASTRRKEVPGIVRGYDAVTGALRWSFTPIQQTDAIPSGAEQTQGRAIGGGNVWAPISADIERDLVFLPTASPAPNFYGGRRPGRNEFANSVIAVRASTGQFVWAFQVVHHDLWDYDLAAQPMLMTILREGRSVPAVAVGTKSGMVFVLDRNTGVPLHSVEERPVAASDVPGEVAWPSQPFPERGFALHSATLTPDSAFGVTSTDKEYCRDLITRLRHDLFSPPSVAGTILWPGVWGGINWDGMAWDPNRQLIVTTLRRLGTIVQIVTPKGTHLANSVQESGPEYLEQDTAFSATRRPFVSPSGIPCSPPPWGLLVAFDLRTRAILWQRPLGTMPELRGISGSENWGSLIFGGPLVTGGGLVFIAGSHDNRFRAFDVENGRLLWERPLRAGGQSSPMTYVYEGRQYVVITAGGRGGVGAPGDWIVAFSLPRGAELTP